MSADKKSEKRRVISHGKSIDAMVADMHAQSEQLPDGLPDAFEKFVRGIEDLRDEVSADYIGAVAVQARCGAMCFHAGGRPSLAMVEGLRALADSLERKLQ